MQAPTSESVMTSTKVTEPCRPGHGQVTWRPIPDTETHTPKNLVMDQKGNTQSAQCLINSTPGIYRNLFDPATCYLNSDNMSQPIPNLIFTPQRPIPYQGESGTGLSAKGNKLSTPIPSNQTGISGGPNIVPTQTYQQAGSSNDIVPSIPNHTEHFEWNLPTWTAPPLDLNNLSESIKYFERFTDIMKMPAVHKQRLLLLELQRIQPNAFKEFLQLGDNSYEGLKYFILHRFDTVSSIHKLQLNPDHITHDAVSQFALMADLYKKTSPEEFVKFLVLRTSPPALQEQLEESISLPYESFFHKYKKSLAKYSKLRKEGPAHMERVGVSSRNTYPQGITQSPYNIPVCEMHKQYGQSARSCSLADCGMKSFVQQAREQHWNYLKNSKKANGQVN